MKAAVTARVTGSVSLPRRVFGRWPRARALPVAKAGLAVKILFAANVLAATPALTADIVNQDNKSYTARVLDPTSSRKVEILGHATLMSVCYSCRIVVQGMGAVEVLPGQNLYIANGAVWAAAPEAAYVAPQTTRERLGLGAPPEPFGPNPLTQGLPPNPPRAAQPPPPTLGPPPDYSAGIGAN